MRKFLLSLCALALIVAPTRADVEEKEAVKIRTMPIQNDVKTIEELYAKNRAAESEFHALMASLRDEFGAELVEREGLKSEARVREKVAKIYDGDLSRVTDILAATLVFDTEEKILAAAEVLKSREYVVRFIDRWTHSKASGYRDFQLKIALSNGTVAELQLHHRKIAEVNRYLDHFLYEFVRQNEGKEGTEAWIRQAKALEREFYIAALNGKYDEMSENSRIRARAIARRLDEQGKAEFLDDGIGIIFLALVDKHRRRHIDTIGSHQTLTEILVEREGASGQWRRSARDTQQFEVARKRPVLTWLAMHRVESHVEFHLVAMHLKGKIVLVDLHASTILQQAVPAFLGDHNNLRIIQFAIQIVLYHLSTFDGNFELS